MELGNVNGLDIRHGKVYPSGMIGNKIFINNLGYCSNLDGYTSLDGDYRIYFPKTNNVGCFHTCRELFAYHFNKNTKFLCFSYKQLGYKDNLIRFSKFWKLIEQKAKVKQHSIIHPTNDSSTIIIELSPFWNINSLRRGFCTLFIRMGAKYFKGNLIEAIDKYYLASRIKAEILYFLQGNTMLTIKKITSGIVNYFTYYGRGTTNVHRKNRYEEILIQES